MKKLIGFSLFLGILSFWWSRESDREDSETCTTPYVYLSDQSRSQIDQLQDGYDPRRFPIEALHYLSAGNEKILFSWDALVDISNKTELGIYHMDRFNVNQVVLMKKNLHYLSTVPGNMPTVLQVSSILSTIDDFFRGETPYIANYEAYHLTPSDFKFTAPSPHTNSTPRYRYFKEGSLLEQPHLSHYDLRFYYNRIEPIDRLAILHRIARSWFRFTNRLELRTWISHGTLLGYYFNGLVMPWDDDLDVQVTALSFEKLKEYNGTVLIDYDDGFNPGKYLIDINPWYGVRSKESDNKIDARFIDVDSGLYIDITTLSHDYIDRGAFDDGGLTEMYKVFNPGFDQIMTETDKYLKEVEEKFNQSMKDEGLVFCKDYHVYNVDELTPLIPTVFEGEVGYVPGNIQNLLLREYKRKSLYLYEYKGFIFDKIKRMWTHKSIKYEYNDLMSKFIRHHESLRQSTIKRRTFNTSTLIRFDSFRVEPWIRKKYQPAYKQGI